MRARHSASRILPQSVKRDAEGGEPVVDLASRMVYVKANPLSIVVLAPVDEILVSKIRTVLNAYSALNRSIDHRNVGCGHDGVTAKNGRHVYNKNFRAISCRFQ